MSEVDEETIIQAMRTAGWDTKQIKAMTYTSWKDGIEIERPSTALILFIRALRPSASIGSELLSFYRRDGLTIISCGVHPLSASAPAGALETELLRNIHDADMAGVPRVRLADACQVHPQAITRWQCGYFPHEVVMRTVIEQAQRLITAPAEAPSEADVARVIRECHNDVCRPEAEWMMSESMSRTLAGAVLALLRQ